MAKKQPAPKAQRKPRRRPASDEAVARYAIRSLADGRPWGSCANWLLAEEDASTVVKVTAILACNRFLAQSIACMPLRVMRRLPNGRKVDATDIQGRDVLTRKPNGYQTTYEWVEQHIWHVGLYGNAYSLRVGDGVVGGLAKLLPKHPSKMDVWWATDDTLGYTLTRANGERETFSAEQVMHTRWLSDGGRKGLVPFELASPALNLARKLDEAALGYWDNGGRPDIVLETDETIPPEARRQMQADWQANHGGAGNRGGVAVLPKKVHLKTVDQNTAEAMQFIELRDSIVPDMARVYGIPSTLLGDHRMAKYSNAEQEFLTAQVFGLMPWQRRLESSIDRSLLWYYGPDVYCKVDSRGLLRGDTASRTSLYQALFQMGSITPNEIRDLEDLPPLDDPAADETFMQLGFSTLGAAAAQAAEPAGAAPSPGAAAADDQGDGGSVDQAGGFTVGQYVFWSDGEGTIEHLMVDGVLGVEGSPFAIAASADAPAASVRVHRDGEPTEFTVGKLVSELSATPMEAAS